MPDCSASPSCGSADQRDTSMASVQSARIGRTRKLLATLILWRIGEDGYLSQARKKSKAYARDAWCACFPGSQRNPGYRRSLRGLSVAYGPMQPSPCFLHPSGCVTDQEASDLWIVDIFPRGTHPPNKASLTQRHRAGQFTKRLSPPTRCARCASSLTHSSSHAH